MLENAALFNQVYKILQKWLCWTSISAFIKVVTLDVAKTQSVKIKKETIRINRIVKWNVGRYEQIDPFIIITLPLPFNETIFTNRKCV